MILCITYKILIPLCSVGFLAPQVVDVDYQSSLILTDHVPNLFMVDSLVSLQ